MADKYKGITIEIDGNTTKLQSALSKVDKQTKDLDKELRKVDKALRINPSSIDLWRQKQALLTDKINETTNRLDYLKQAQKEMDAKNVDKNSEEYKRLQREIVLTESELKQAEGELKKIGNIKLKALQAQIKGVGDKLTAAGNAMRGVSMAAAAVAASIGALTTKSAKWADDIVTASKVYSMSTQELQKYNAAAELVDVNAEAIVKTHRKLERNMLNASLGSKKQELAFKELGIEYKNVDGSLRDGDQVWTETIEALSKMENETERDAYAMALLGNKATELNPLIEDGAEGYKLLTDAMEKYDLEFVDEETLQRANDFNDLLDVMKSVGMIAFQQVGTQLAAYLVPAMEKVVDLVGRLANWFSQLSPRTQAIIAAIAGVIAVVAPLLLGLGKLAFAISSIVGLINTIGPAIGGLMSGSLLPIIGIIAAVIAIGVLLYKNWDTIKAKAIEIKDKVVKTFTELKTKITTVFNNVKTAISNAVNTIKTKITSTFNAIKSTVSSIWNGIKNAITNPIQTAVNIVKNAIAKIKSIINGAKLSLPHFKLPHFRISGGKLPWGIGGKGTAPKISVDWYAQGGIFDRASSIGVGEAGSEAVVPLDTLWRKLDKIAEASNGGAIVVNVYGSDNMSVNELAAAVEQRIIQMQKRRSIAWQ